MLKKQINIKGLRKKVLKLEYENKLLDSTFNENLNKKSLPKKKNPNLNYRILILRNTPIDDTLLKQFKQKINFEGNEITHTDLNNTSKKNLCLLNKCIKKNILKKVIIPKVETQKEDFEKTWLQCKYIYWLAPEATSLKEQLLHLNVLKTYIRAEPKEAFLGCLLESKLLNDDLLNSVHTENNVNTIKYKYYYPSQILTLCDLMDKTDKSSIAGLVVLNNLLQTIETSINSMSMLLALKKNTFMTQE